MKSNSVLIVGCGDLGVRLGTRLQSPAWQLFGARREPSHLPPDIGGYAADYTRPGDLAFMERLRPDYVVATFGPTDRSEAGYRAGFSGAMGNLLAGLGAHRPRHIFAVSSTRVFAERLGGWVDENSALEADDPCAGAMIAAEQLLLSSSHAATVLRFAGIYGAPGGRLLARVARGEFSNPLEPRYSNRVHREDCAGFIAHLLHMAEAGRVPAAVYVGVDDEPTPGYVVEAWLARQLGVAVPAATGRVSEAVPGHRRCSNELLRQSGYRLQYPEYRSGYRAVLAASQDGV